MNIFKKIKDFYIKAKLNYIANRQVAFDSKTFNAARNNDASIEDALRAVKEANMKS